MKISELIKNTSELLMKYGDIEVTVEDNHGFYEIESIRNEKVLDKSSIEHEVKDKNCCFIKRKHYEFE